MAAAELTPPVPAEVSSLWGRFVTSDPLPPELLEQSLLWLGNASRVVVEQAVQGVRPGELIIGGNDVADGLPLKEDGRRVSAVYKPGAAGAETQITCVARLGGMVARVTVRSAWTPTKHQANVLVAHRLGNFRFLPPVHAMRRGRIAAMAAKAKHVSSVAVRIAELDEGAPAEAVRGALDNGILLEVSATGLTILPAAHEKGLAIPQGGVDIHEARVAVAKGEYGSYAYSAPAPNSESFADVIKGARQLDESELTPPQRQELRALLTRRYLDARWGATRILEFCEKALRDGKRIPPAKLAPNGQH